jgi:hypothetical protein
MSQLPLLSEELSHEIIWLLPFDHLSPDFGLENVASARAERPKAKRKKNVVRIVTFLWW